MKMSETFYLYAYRASLGGKHLGIEKSGPGPEVIAEALRRVNNNDVIEIRVTDTSDFMVFHWTAQDGLQFPDGAELQPEAQKMWQARPERMTQERPKCPTCGEDILGFRDELGKKEFTISKMCQKCQDSVFGP